MFAHLGENREDVVRGGRKAHVRPAPGIDADDLAVGVDERPARVARVDRGVRLQPKAIFARVGEIASCAGDDADRHRAVQAKRCAHGHHEIAFLEFQRLAKPRCGQGGQALGAFGDALELDECEVGVLVVADFLGVEIAAIGEEAANLACFVDHVPVRENLALDPVDDHTTAEDLLGGLSASRELLAETLDIDNSGEDLGFGVLDGFAEVHRRHRAALGADREIVTVAPGENRDSQQRQAHKSEKRSNLHSQAFLLVLRNGCAILFF